VKKLQSHNLKRGNKTAVKHARYAVPRILFPFLVPFAVCRPRFKTQFGVYRTTKEFKPFEAEARQKTFKKSVRTAKKTQVFTITKINRLTLFKEIIHIKRINTRCRANGIHSKAAVIYNYHSTSND
jgi:hypothetical protein